MYSTLYQKESARDIIQEEIRVEEEVAIKHRTTTMYRYYFLINDYEVPVRPSDYRAYKVGDKFEYYLYSKNDVVKEDRRNYSFAEGLLGLLAEGVVFWTAISYMNVNTRAGSANENTKNKDNAKGSTKDNANTVATGRFILLIFIVFLMVVLGHYMKIIYYFIYLFT